MKAIQGIFATVLIIGGIWTLFGLIAWLSGSLPDSLSPSDPPPGANADPGQGGLQPLPPPTDLFGRPIADPPPEGTTPSSAPGGAPDIEAASRAAGGYTEPLCNPTAVIDDLSASYDANNLRPTFEALAQRRYPIGLPFVQAQEQNALQTWTQDRSTFESAANAFEVVAHEGSHIYGATRIRPQTYTYRVREDLEVQARRLRNFARSEILSLHTNRSADRYVDTYLQGQSGTQGFNTLLDEYNAYVHGLAARWCTRDLIPSGYTISSRAGPLTMMYWVSLYLRLAREQHPDDYQAIISDPGHVQLILTVWDRARFWLAITANEPQLSGGDDEPERWATAPETVAEIDRLRAAP